jgi:hypothetical protein
MSRVVLEVGMVVFNVKGWLCLGPRYNGADCCAPHSWFLRRLTQGLILRFGSLSHCHHSASWLSSCCCEGDLSQSTKDKLLE